MWMRTLVVPRDHVLHGSTDVPGEGRQFWRTMGMPTVSILDKVMQLVAVRTVTMQHVLLLVAFYTLTECAASQNAIVSKQ